MPHEYKDGETVDGTQEGPIIHGLDGGASGTVRAMAISASGGGNVVLYNVSGDPITSTTENGDTALDVHLSNSFPQAANNASTAVTISNTAAPILSSNAARLGVVISNNSTGDLYVGVDTNVTTSGATMGIKVSPGGSLQDGEVNVYTGEWWGIYSAAAATQNVSVMEIT